MSNPESDEGSSTIDELLKELEKETLPEDSSPSNNNEKIKDKQADETLKKLKHEKPDWVDKKDDDYNSYDYSDNKELEDIEW